MTNNGKNIRTTEEHKSNFKLNESLSDSKLWEYDNMIKEIKDIESPILEHHVQIITKAKENPQSELKPVSILISNRFYYYLFLLPPFILSLIFLKFAFVDNIWKKMAYLGSFVLILGLYVIFKFTYFMLIGIPSKMKNKKIRITYFLILLSLTSYAYYSRFYSSSSKLNYTLDTYYKFNSPYDS